MTQQALTDQNTNRDLLSVPDPVATPALPTPRQASSASMDTANSRDLMPTVNTPVNTNQARPTPVTTQVQGNETVSGQLRDLLDTESPYLEQGRQQGLRYASQRGLQNSTMAAQAGEQGRIAAALPIAQQDAATFAGRAELNQNTQNQFRAANLDHINRLIETAQQGDINSRLQMEQFGFNSQLSAQENLQRLEQMAFAGDIDARQSYLNFAYQTMLADVNQGHALQLEDQRFQNQQSLVAQEFSNALGLTAAESQARIEQLNAQHQNTLEEIAARGDIDAADDNRQFQLQLQGNYLAQVAQRQQMASQEIAQIYQTEGLTSAQQQQAVYQAERRLRDDIALLGAYYARAPQWDDDFDFSATSPTPYNGVPPQPDRPRTGYPPITGGGTRDVSRRDLM